MATATTSFPGTYLRVPPKNGVRNALFSRSVVSNGVNSRKPNSLNSLKLSRNSFNVCLHTSFGHYRKSSKSGAFIVRCNAAAGKVSLYYNSPVSNCYLLHTMFYAQHIFYLIALLGEI